MGKSDNVLDKLENLKEITNDKKVYEEASILETKYNKGKRNIIKNAAYVGTFLVFLLVNNLVGLSLTTIGNITETALLCLFVKGIIVVPMEKCNLSSINKEVKLLLNKEQFVNNKNKTMDKSFSLSNEEEMIEQVKDKVSSSYDNLSNEQKIAFLNYYKENLLMEEKEDYDIKIYEYKNK